MNTNDAESWHLEIIGAAMISAPSGEEIIVSARFCWTMTAEHTLRLLLYIDDIPTPIVRVLAPQERHAVAKSAVRAFRELIGPQPVPAQQAS